MYTYTTAIIESTHTQVRVRVRVRVCRGSELYAD